MIAQNNIMFYNIVNRKPGGFKSKLWSKHLTKTSKARRTKKIEKIIK